MPPTFSVVIPTYNQAEFLREAVNSVLAQTYADFEVIIVNNYSTDHTLEVVRELGDRRVRVIDFQNNGVIGAGRNVGINASHGAYVAFLDSDDTWYSTKLERIADEIEKDPQIGLVCHDQLIVRDGGPAKRTRYGPRQGFSGTTFDYLLYRGNGPPTSAVVVARRALGQVDYFSEDPALATVEDTDLWLRLSKVCQVKFLREILGTYNLRSFGASSNIEVHLNAGLAVLDRHAGEQQGKRSWALRHQRANLFYGAARQYQRRGVFSKSVGHFRRTLKIYPLHLRALGGLALLCAGLLLGHRLPGKLADLVWKHT